MDNKNLIEHLKCAGMKATPQRLAIYRALVLNHNHPTAENIYEEIKESNPTISLGTVYSTLETLVKNKLAEKVHIKSGNYRYDANTDTHSHIYLTNTNEIVDYKDEELSEIIKEYFRNKKFKNIKINDIRLQISGEKIDLEKKSSIK